MNVDERDIGSHLTPQYGGNATQVAAGAGDNTAVHSAWIDRNAVNGPGFLSALFGVAFTATLTAAATLSIAYKIEDATDNAGAGAADFKVVAGAVVATGPGGGGTVTGAVSSAVNLAGARQFIRLTYTPDLSAGAADTSITSGILILGGKQEEP